MRILSLVLAVCLVLSASFWVGASDYDDGYVYMALYTGVYGPNDHPFYEPFCPIQEWRPADLVPVPSVDYLSIWSFRDLATW